MSKDTVPRSGQPFHSTNSGDGDSGERPQDDSTPTLDASLASPVPDGHTDDSQMGKPQPASASAYISAATPTSGITRPIEVEGIGPAKAATTAPLTPPATLGGPPVRTATGLPAERRASPAELVRASRRQRRLVLKFGLVLMAAILLVETLNLSPWTDAFANQPPRQPDAIPLAEVQPYGVNTFLHKEVDSWKKKTTLDMARDMGATWIKQQFPWAEIEFGKDSYWDAKNNQSAWQKFDEIVDLAQQHGLRVIARIDSTPEWARTDDSMTESVRKGIQGNQFYAKFPPSPGHLTDFGDFIHEFVKRYKGRVPVIQVWNEPNLANEWPSGVNAVAYTNLLQTAYTAAMSVDHNIVIMAAPLATNNETLNIAGNLNELDYLQAMYYAGAKPYFDAMSATAYGKGFPPEDPPSPDKLNFRRVELLRKVMEKNGDRNKAIWFNEYGWNASPDNLPTPTDPNQVTYPWDRVAPEQQADYTVRGIEYAREHWPWAGVFTIWYLRQVGDIPNSKSEYYFGLINPDFVPSDTYNAVQVAANNTDKIARPGTWGPLTSPVDAGPQWHMMLNPDVPGGVYVAPSAVGDKLEIPFAGTDVKLTLVPITGTSTLTATYYVSVDGTPDKVAPELPRDSTGRAYIAAPASGQITQVTVVRSLDAELRTGTHTLQITVVAGSGGAKSANGSLAIASHTFAPLQQQLDLPGIGAITVEARRSYVLFTALTLLLLAGISFTAWALWRSRPSLEQGTHGR